AFYRQAQSIDQKPDVWTLLFDETGRLVTTVHVPVPPTPHGRYVVGQALSVEHWRQTALQPSGRADWIVGVIDRNGKFVARSHMTDALIGRPARPELVAAARAASAGLLRHATIEGIDAYDSFSHSTLTGWTVAVAAPVHSIDASATDAVAWLLAGLAAALGLALGAAGWLNRSLIRAIDSASDAAHALGAGRTPTPLRTSLDEVNALGQALQDAGQLLAAEQAARAEVEAQREQLLDNERAARAAAQNANAAKDEFLALLGHELRNPLAAIAGATEVLARAPTRDASGARFLAIIQRQNRHLRQVVDDLLEVSRMLSGKIALDARPIDLAECVRRCVEALGASEAAAGHTLSVQAAEVWIDGDPVRIEQIVNNLVGNALKFSPPGFEVCVAVRPEAGQALIEVSDRGSGIAAELMPRIFEPFVQGPALRGLQASGLGIGLSLVRNLVELHGGAIVARSVGAGQGTVFTVTLPRIGAPAEAPAPLPSLASAAPMTLPSLGLQPEAAPIRVLLVEDNPDARAATAQMLRLSGHEVAEVEDGEAALRRLAAERPDVVVLDIGMPGKDGYQIAAEIRATPALRDLPLIALSGYGQERDLDASAHAGFDAHLVKPVSPQALDAAIRTQLALRRQPPGRRATELLH
ncbi:MAG: ATP-binding protein, partial [Burkholderiaceae bacterium]